MIERTANEHVVNLLDFSGRAKLPMILQSEAAECGLACLTMVAQYHGHKTDLNALRTEHAISLKGATVPGLINIAQKLHLAGRALRVSLSELAQLKAPCLLHWNLNHYVVLKQANKHHITVHDPALGVREYRLDEASKHFSGVVLELTPTREFKPLESTKQARFADFWQGVIGLKRTLLQVFLLSMMLQLFAIISPFYLQLVVDEVIISQDVPFLQVLACGFGLLLLVQLFMAAFRSTVILYMSNQLSVQYANNLLRHLLKLPMAYFEKRHMGDIVSRFGSLEQIKQLLTTGLIETMVDGVMAIGLIVMMYVYSTTLGVIVTLAFVVYTLFRYVMYQPLRAVTEENIMAQAKQNSNFMETIRGMQTIKLFGHETQRQMQWNNHYVDELNTGIKIGQLHISYTLINGLIFGLENILVIYVAAALVMDNLLSVGMLFAFMSYKTQFIEKVSNLVDKLIEFKMMSLHLQRLGDITLSEQEQDLEGRAADFKPAGQISCHGVSFAYDDNTPDILNNLNFNIAAGSCVAIVGGSGCGKTTLVKVMLGLLSATTGCVKIDGRDIRKVGLRNYRQALGSVMQDDALLSGTIADNICFFDPQRDDEQMQACARMAAIHDDITAMPMGYHSLIGDMGSGLSGGQKQRLLLARALYKKPRVLFLDEATSHLDVFLESRVNEAIKGLNITRIIVAHRKETIATADQVIVLYNGQASVNNTADYIKCLRT